MANFARNSSLYASAQIKRADLQIAESSGFSLTQIAGFGRAFEKSLAGRIGKLPVKVGIAAAQGERTLMRVGPLQFWIIGPENDAIAWPDDVLVTRLSSSRARIAMEGAAVRRVLSTCAPLDFHESAFRPGMFAQTGIHHTPALIHCTGDDAFHIYAMRSFAKAVWEWLEDAQEGLAE
jgi:heterotetrameric sarcosine oxidase gamma subunit